MNFPNGFLYPLLLFIQLPFCSSISAITSAHPVADGGVLVSQGETFALGFFSPRNSRRRYVGVWYNKVSEQTVVWVANRDDPLNDTSGVLSINGAGNLIIQGNASSTPVWSTNISAPLTNNSDSVVAHLLDTGNLVLIRQSTQEIVWQGFDYPTQTMMPFMKLGLDRKTGLNRFLTSWRSPDDPGFGSCTYRIDPTGTPQLFLYKGSARGWRAGPWNGVRWSGVPEMTNKYIFNLTYVEDRDEIYVMYGILNASIFSRMVLDESGSVQRFTWHETDRRWVEFWSAPKDRCDDYGRCGAYSYCDPNGNSDEFECKCLPGFEPKSPQDWYLRDGSKGCTRKRADSVCGSGEGFVKFERVKVPDTSVARVNMSMSGEACEEECLRNCTCMAYTSADVRRGGRGCLTWHGDLVDTKLYASEGQDLYIRVDSIELAKTRKSSNGIKGTKRTIVIVAGPIVLVGLLLVIFYLCKRHSKIRGHWGKQSRSKMLLFNLATTHKDYPEEDGHDVGERNVDLPFFNLRDIKCATNNFSDKLGEGGFGEVYKGHLSNGQEIAVKRLLKCSSQGVEEFKNEVLLIARLQHRNLVKVLGCCIDGDETMLIYEYMPNKSLNSFIFDDIRKALLDWKKRYEIIIGIARGILYLHQDSRLKIIHRDLKASNILLDGDMNPKISDFGLARIFGRNQTQANTNRVVGTFGYMSPEYALDGLFSMKSDVFSFGVLLLEIISGKKNLTSYNDDPLSNLIKHTWDLWSEDRALEIVDFSIGNSWQELEVLRCVQVGLLCVQGDPVDRPTMSTIVVMLSNEVTLPSPKQPAFVVKQTNKDPNSNLMGSTSSTCFKNEMTITMIAPR
ncbi:G-type lectin S-receptor-like serine/threonine-protein kinase At1g11410 isoform X2 [Malania oleifera]|uniref:G-type lectin S-receptor-like serine/threonine-protein kinase At1g11410 isoform X2 n=1 Tax=Malania oleifera TaxID=397392 RepID=UPI0025AE9384|nr:G-type lectin S-receptor-like serine/threonine-protein kinase At1g11410 isoform X2 [Malania oleifera]